MGQAMHRLPRSAAVNTRFAPTPSFSKPRNISLTAAASVLRAAREAGDTNEVTATAFVSAVRLYEDGHWEFAFERLTALADDGHAPAAKLALLMLRYGRALYGKSFSARPAQVARWAQRVLKATPSVASRSMAPAASIQ
jgi:hypothetical protein